jgi:multiple sugar transport system permease protein
MHKTKPLTRGLTYLFLIVATGLLLYPVVYMLLGSFTTPSRLLATIMLPIPNTLNLPIIVGAWNNGLWQAYVFTLARCLFYIALGLFVGLFGGYVFSKLKFPGRNRLFLLFLSGLVMPAILLLVPMYLMVARFPLLGGNTLFGQGGQGLINDLRSLFLFGWVSPFAIFLFKQSYDMLPTDYEEAAKMDGAGLLTIIFRVYGPLLKPVIAALIVITFLSIWNDYLWPSLIITDRPEFLPITLRVVGTGLSNTSSTGSPSPAAFMRILLALWPPALVYLIFQRYFIQGLVASGLKG